MVWGQCWYILRSWIWTCGICLSKGTCEVDSWIHKLEFRGEAQLGEHEVIQAGDDCPKTTMVGVETEKWVDLGCIVEV